MPNDFRHRDVLLCNATLGPSHPEFRRSKEPSGALRGFLCWKLFTPGVPRPDHVEAQFDKPPRRVEAGELWVSYVGHATVLVQFDGLNILTDLCGPNGRRDGALQVRGAFTLRESHSRSHESRRGCSRRVGLARGLCSRVKT